jgi:hypothetical protein
MGARHVSQKRASSFYYWILRPRFLFFSVEEFLFYPCTYFTGVVFLTSIFRHCRISRNGPGFLPGVLVSTKFFNTWKGMDSCIGVYFIIYYFTSVYFQDYSTEGMSESLLVFLQHLREFGLVYQRKVIFFQLCGLQNFISYFSLEESW